MTKNIEKKKKIDTGVALDDDFLLWETASLIDAQKFLKEDDAAYAQWNTCLYDPSDVEFSNSKHKDVPVVESYNNIEAKLSFYDKAQAHVDAKKEQSWRHAITAPNIPDNEDEGFMGIRCPIMDNFGYKAHEYRAIDPKQSHGSEKLSFDNVPISLLLHAVPGANNGANKYKPWNWLQLPDGEMSLKTYLNAIQRHLLLYRAGQDVASDSGVHHLDHIIAGLAVLRDAQLFGKVADDRIKLSEEQLQTLENKINGEVDK